MTDFPPPNDEPWKRPPAEDNSGSQPAFPPVPYFGPPAPQQPIPSPPPAPPSNPGGYLMPPLPGPRPRLFLGRYVLLGILIGFIAYCGLPYLSGGIMGTVFSSTVSNSRSAAMVGSIVSQLYIAAAIASPIVFVCLRNRIVKSIGLGMMIAFGLGLIIAAVACFTLLPHALG